MGTPLRSRPAVAEQGGVGVQQVEGAAVAHGRPVKAVEAEGRPDLGAAAGAVVEDENGGVAAGHAGLRARVYGEGHESSLASAGEFILPSKGTGYSELLRGLAWPT